MSSANLIIDRSLPATWKLQNIAHDLYEHIHLGHHQIEAAGRYRVVGLITTMAFQQGGTAAPGSYLLVKCCLHFDGAKVQTVTGRDAEIFCVVSQFRRWSISTVNPDWLIDVDGLEK